MSEPPDWHDALIPPYAWPSPEHNLRAVDSDWWTHSLISPGDLQARMWGMREAADVLSASMLVSRRHLDLLVYPFGLVWRFYLELRLKTLLAELRSFLEKPRRDDFTHSIDDLWARLKPLISEVPGGDDSALPDVDRVLKQFAELDPRSESFRYSVDRKGRDWLSDVDRLSIPRMHEALAGAAAWLDALGDMVGYEHDMKRDYETAMRDWHGEGW